MRLTSIGAVAQVIASLWPLACSSCANSGSAALLHADGAENLKLGHIPYLIAWTALLSGLLQAFLLNQNLTDASRNRCYLPWCAMDDLIEGYRRFRTGTWPATNAARFEELSRLRAAAAHAGHCLLG